MVLVLGPFGAILYLVLRPRETLAEKYERSLEEEALLQDIEERQICPGCKQPIERDFMICPICHVTLRQPCVHCGRLVHPRWNVCPYCGNGQQPVPGVEAAGKVTLADLEDDLALKDGQLPETLLESDLEDIVEQAEVGVDDREDVENQPELEKAWGGNPEEPVQDDDPLADLFSEEDETSEPGATAESEEEGSETETADDDTPRRPLSLFKRP
jgi:RNA polymerase subunit RPABC4/transcription elongation factor Spt4